MKLAGIDGCKYGWVIIIYNEEKFYYKGIYKTIKDLIENNQDLDAVIIDMPIGLSSKSNLRTVEKEMRDEMEYRHSTVFNPPCRKALKSNSHEEASLINLDIEGKKISIQAFSIKDKIKEIDDCYDLFKEYKIEILESHPEICFKYLNNSILSTKKSKPDGIRERLEILSQYYSDSEKVFQYALSSTLRKELKKDDIIDALCLCIVNKLGKENSFSFITDSNGKDEKGIERKIAYFNRVVKL